MKNLSIKAKLLFIVIGSILVVSAVILVKSSMALYDTSEDITNDFKKSSFQSKKTELKNYIKIALSYIEVFYKKAQEDPVNVMKYKKDALKAIETIKYDEDGYFFIINSTPIMLMDASNHILNGKDLSKIKDSNKALAFKKIVEVTKENGEGLIEHMWPKPHLGKLQPKFFYAIKFQPWDWIICTSEYVDDVAASVSEMEEETKREIYTTIIMIIAVMIVLAFFMLVIARKTIFEPLEKFQDGLLSFFKYLNKEQSNVSLLDDSRGDEIGIMSKKVNENIKKTQSLIEQDMVLIEDVKRVVGEVKRGYLDKKIEKTTQNESLKELQIIFNEMLDIMQNNFHNNINELKKVLVSFKNRNFKTDIDKPKGEVAKTLNELAEIINKMLLDNLKNGSIMNENANTLKNNVKQLSISSNDQAASLEETAATLEEITSAIQTTSNSITEMASYTDELSQSIQIGQNLANETTCAMDEINEQTQLIAQAITVIDQITFQTNILSLNAAVEAATVGEMGKGFAVVAQEVRNLASRSAQAAKEIKNIVQNATSKANRGKDISVKMIEGYQAIYNKAQQTNEILSDIRIASKEQSVGILQINDAITQLDKATQENASVANNTSEIAKKTSKMAIGIVEEVNKSEFRGKDSIEKARAQTLEKIAKEKSSHTTTKFTPKPITIGQVGAGTIITAKSDDGEWESF